MNEQKMKEVFSDEEFVKSLLELETPEEVQKALAEKDIDLTIEEIKTIAEMVQKNANGELTDEDLDEVTGGSVLVAIKAIGAVVLGVITAVNAVQKIFRRW